MAAYEQWGKWRQRPRVQVESTNGGGSGAVATSIRRRCVAPTVRPPGDLFGGEVVALLSGGEVAAARCESRGWCVDVERGAWAQAAGLSGESGFEMGGSKSEGGRRTAAHHGPRRRRARVGRWWLWRLRARAARARGWGRRWEEAVHGRAAGDGVVGGRRARTTEGGNSRRRGALWGRAKDGRRGADARRQSKKVLTSFCLHFILFRSRD
jgi:hypothetical protein